jgi:transposase
LLEVKDMRGRKKKSRAKKERVSASTLPVIRPQVAGIDIGSREHWVCGPQREDGEPNVRVFGTTTPQLEELANWLLEQGVQSVAMESTGVYWIPVYELLESRGIEVVLVNARHVKNVPGRKTDMQDCQWIQLLHSHGLLQGSFRPAESICALRALRRQHGALVGERSKAVQWMQKALDQMNVQVHHAVTDITGVTGMAIVRAIVAGKRDPHELAKHRDHHCKKSEEEIAGHLKGNWRDEHLFNLESALRLYDHLQEQIAVYERKIHENLESLQPPERKDTSVPPHPNKRKEKAIRRKSDQALREALYRFAGVDLLRIDGIGVGATRVVLTEVGPDVTAFPTESDFVSWLRLAPNTPISGGKRLKKKRKGMGATRVEGALRMAALSLQHSKTALGASYRRIARHKSAGVAVFATARRLATLIYRMLRYGQDYVDEGEQSYEARFQKRRMLGLKASASALGFQLVPVAAAEPAST